MHRSLLLAFAFPEAASACLGCFGFIGQIGPCWLVPKAGRLAFRGRPLRHAITAAHIKREKHQGQSEMSPAMDQLGLFCGSLAPTTQN